MFPIKIFSQAFICSIWSGKEMNLCLSETRMRQNIGIVLSKHKIAFYSRNSSIIYYKLQIIISSSSSCSAAFSAIFIKNTSSRFITTLDITSVRNWNLWNRLTSSINFRTALIRELVRVSTEHLTRFVRRCFAYFRHQTIVARVCLKGDTVDVWKKDKKNVL